MDQCILISGSVLTPGAGILLSAAGSVAVNGEACKFQAFGIAPVSLPSLRDQPVNPIVVCTDPLPESSFGSRLPKQRRYLSANRDRGESPSKHRSGIAPRCLKTRDAARYLGMSAWALREEVKKGELHFVSSGEHTSSWKFDVHDLDAWIDRHKIKF